jgi:hypothetical protein
MKDRLLAVVNTGSIKCMTTGWFLLKLTTGKGFQGLLRTSCIGPQWPVVEPLNKLAEDDYL